MVVEPQEGKPCTYQAHRRLSVQDWMPPEAAGRRLRSFLLKAPQSGRSGLQGELSGEAAVVLGVGSIWGHEFKPLYPETLLGDSSLPSCFESYDHSVEILPGAAFLEFPFVLQQLSMMAGSRALPGSSFVLCRCPSLLGCLRVDLRTV